MVAYDPPKGAFDHGYPYWPKETRTVKLIPHGHTVLVEPDLPPEKTESNILLPEDHFFMPTSGTVVAVGKGSKRLWETRQKERERIFRAIEDTGEDGPYGVLGMVRNALGPLAMPAPSVSVGERVVFAAQAGLTIKDEDGKEYILLDEDRIAIVVEEEESVA